ncbi:NADH dehydrogenase (ubiquinone) complex I, assembly factor 6 homolog [Scaptodrosophila lebanonensis]|uniref:NADH dehydrogenase (Ubiquinone) complex I, assembly factor 6 homolog n=1 Tax=Drosophila lebanonensis TaxID=7225 RepID=A0A6J2UDZ0_DROLE|nr:NADH dehydrogenase (ubiquinone) complex I, assembly factor 6 homolog [Scaptodrosophila lebanonensis]
MRRLLSNWENGGRLLSNKNSIIIKCLERHASGGVDANVQPGKERQPAQKSPAENGDAFATKYCMGLVEKYDYENYLSTLLLPQELRQAAFALRAFNVEVSRSVVGHHLEPQITKMRLKFWYDSIDKCFEPATNKSYVQDQPVLRELQRTVGVRRLNKVYLRRLVTARERPSNQAFDVMRDLEDYADQTCASLMHLLVELSGIRDINVDHAASHVGKAQGIVMLLRAIPHTGRQQAVAVPLEVLVRHGVSQERILRGAPDDKAVEECVFEVASAANTHLELARQLLPQMPRVARKIFLSAVATGSYLERLRRAHFQLTHASCIKRDSMLPARLFWKSLFNKF